MTEGGRPRLTSYSHAGESGPQPPSAFGISPRRAGGELFRGFLRPHRTKPPQLPQLIDPTQQLRLTRDQPAPADSSSSPAPTPCPPDSLPALRRGPADAAPRSRTPDASCRSDPASAPRPSARRAAESAAVAAAAHTHRAPQAAAAPARSSGATVAAPPRDSATATDARWPARSSPSARAPAAPPYSVGCDAARPAPTRGSGRNGTAPAAPHPPTPASRPAPHLPRQHHPLPLRDSGSNLA